MNLSCVLTTDVLWSVAHTTKSQANLARPRTDFPGDGPTDGTVRCLLRTLNESWYDSPSRAKPESGAMPTSLLCTKLFVPPGSPKVVPCPNLIERLDEGVRSGHKLILVSAPAGYGKTTLLGEWIAHGELRTRVGWVSLDEGDNDPARFWAYVVAALQTVEEGIGAIDHTAPESPHPPIESALTGLLNEIAGASGPVVLVLDDYHVINAPAVHEALSFLLEYLPPQMHLVIATRADPPLPIARLRGRGHLSELRTADLCFTADEAAAFLNDMMGLGISARCTCANTSASVPPV